MPELEGRITGDPTGFISASKKSQASLSKLTKQGLGSGKSLSKSFKKVRDSFNRVAKAAGAAALKVGVLAAAAGTAALAAGAVKVINLAREQIKVEKQLAAVLKSTGGAAGITAREIKAHASALQKVTNFGDEVTISAQAMLLTFTKIGREVFPQVTEIVQDMAVAMKVGLKEAAIQVGKALNDPIKGVSALSRVGITFSEVQKEQIKNFQESGQLMKAQGVVLKELQKQFAGSARAIVDPLIQMKNAIGDVGEELGKALLPAVNKMAKFFTSRMTQIQEAVFVFVDTGKALFSEFASAIGVSFGTVGGLFDKILRTIKENKDRIIGFAKEIARIGAFIVKGFVFVGTKIKEFIQPAIDVFTSFLEKIGIFKSSITEKFAAVVTAFQTLGLAVKAAFQSVGAALTFGVERFLAFRGSILSGVAAVLNSLSDFSRNAIKVLAGIAVGFSRFGTVVKLSLKESAAGWLVVIENVLARMIGFGESLGVPTGLLQVALAKLRGISKDVTASMAEDQQVLVRAYNEVIEKIGTGVPDGLAKASKSMSDLAVQNEQWRKVAEETFNLLKRDTKATAKELADVEGRYLKIVDAINKVGEAGKQQIKNEKEVNGLLASQVRLREQLAPKKTFRSTRRAGGGARGRLTLGIAGRRRRGQASFPGLTGAAGQFGTTGSRHFGGFLSRSGPFSGQRGEFVIKRQAAQAIGPARLRGLNNMTINNTINASDQSVMGTREKIRAMLPELRRQTRLGVLQGGPF